MIKTKAKLKRARKPVVATPLLVAKDTLKLLDQKRIKPMTGIYGPDTTDWQAYFAKLQKHCEVCQLGGLLAGYASRFDQVNQWDRRKLKEIFGEEQLSLIETAFEGFWCGYGQPVNIWAAMEFGNRFESDRRRFRAILNNMIAHGGKFVPEEAGKSR